MDLPVSIQRALQRLNGAIDALDAAAERRAEADAARADADAEYAVMQDDRSRLAVELDAALARARTLERVAGDVAARVDRAGAAVQSILSELEPAGPTPPGPA